LSTTGNIDLYFGDESALSMNPCLPYGWQKRGETVGIVPQTNRKINVFGIFRADNYCFTRFSGENINGKSVIAAIDEFAKTLAADKPSVLVLDNASTHHSKMFDAQVARWEQSGLYVFYLPTYSPHLNLAEIFWRKAKYEWLKPADYLSFETFKEKVADIFANIGTHYKIIFKEQKGQINFA